MNFKIKQQLPLLALTGAIFFGSCSKSEQGSELPEDFEERSFEVKTFDQIKLKGFYEINLVKSDQSSLKISGTPEDLDLIDAVTKDNVLEIAYREEESQDYPMLLEITSASFKELLMAGALGGNSIVDGFTQDDIRLKIAGGSGSLSLNNCTYDNAIVILNGAGKVDLLESEVSRAVVEVNGAGSVSINVKDHLDASIRGVGLIRYDGSPEIIESVSGIGTISHI